MNDSLLVWLFHFYMVCFRVCLLSLCNKEVFSCFMNHEWMVEENWHRVSAYHEPGLMLSISVMNVTSFNFLSLRYCLIHLPNLTLSNKSLGYHSKALFSVSLPFFRPKQKVVCSGFWILQALELNEEKWGVCLLFPVLCLLRLLCICVKSQRDGGTEELKPPESPCPQNEWWSFGHQHHGQKTVARIESTGNVGTICLSFHLLSILNRFPML